MIRFLGIPFLFVFASLCVWSLAVLGPDWGGERQIGLNWRFPTNFHNATKVITDLERYKTEHRNYLLTLFVATYLYKQAFAIPGSFFLNIVAGALFDQWLGFLLACALSTLGATICYFLADFFGKQYVVYYFGDKLSYYHQKVEENSGRLFLFLIFGRMFPISPSWLLNIIAPFLDVPVHLFILSVFIGLAPYNFLCVQAGATLSELRSWEDVFNFGTMLKLSAIAIVPFLMAWYLRPRQSKEFVSLHARSESV